jgi:chaperone BCS1
MTTNHPEKLDEALIRPGRVDHQVAFSNAMQHQIQELFERMYTNDLPRTTKIPSSPAPSSSPSPSTIYVNKPSPTENGNVLMPPLTPIKVISNAVAKGEKRQREDLSEEELSKIARKFAAQVPDDMFSPAEIQGFLLKRKTEPRRALEEVAVWVEGMKNMKMKGGARGRLVSVQ